jgi:hypothetical protein
MQQWRLVNNSNHLNMFRGMISLIFRSTRLFTTCGIMQPRCCRPAISWVHYTTSCKHSLVILKMGEIIPRNMLRWLELLISRYWRSQWPRGLWRGSAAGRLLGLWVRIPLVAWMFVCCECCVLLGRGLWDELIACPEESYRLCCAVLCDLETSRMRRPWPALGLSAIGKEK